MWPLLHILGHGMSGAVVVREERAAAAEALGMREGKLAAKLEELELRSEQVRQQTAALAADRLALQASTAPPAAFRVQALLPQHLQPCVSALQAKVIRDLQTCKSDRASVLPMCFSLHRIVNANPGNCRVRVGWFVVLR